MENKIAVGIATIVNHGLLEKCIKSLLKQTLKPEILVVANTHRVRDSVSDIESMEGVSAAYFDENLGVAGSWNFAISTFLGEGKEFVVITGDDIEFLDETTLNHFANSVEKDDNHVYYAYNRGFSLFCMTKKVWNNVGQFDDGFWPGYYEDNDYYRRMMLAGVGWIGLPFETEHVGSASINSDNTLRGLNQAFFPQNRQRYIAKWGGEPHQETYAVPWNGQDAWPPLGGDRKC